VEKLKNYWFLLKAWPLVVVLVVALALVAGLSIRWWQVNLQEEQSVTLSQRSQRVIALLNDMQDDVRDLVIGQRSYALTREEDLLAPYREATNALPDVLNNLRELVAEYPDERAQYANLRVLVQRFVELNREHLDDLMQDIPHNSEAEFRDQAQAGLDRIRLVHHHLEAEENRQMNEQRRDLMETVKDVTQLNLAGGVAGVALIYLAVTALWQENRRRRAMEHALRLSHEELERRVQERTVSLRENQARLQLAQSAAHIGTFEWDFRTGSIVRSPELAAMYGLPNECLTRPSEEWMKRVHPDDRMRVDAWTRQTRETGRAVEGEWRVVWPDGSIHWLFGRWQALLDERGQPLRMVGVNMDITERKRLEEDLLQASDNEMRRIGHDLHDGVGQQLTALTLFNASLQAGLAGQPPQLAVGLEKMGEALHEIVREIRVLSHGLAPVPFEQSGLADALHQLASDTTSMAKVACEFREEGPVPPTDAQQAAQLYRIAQEAVSNALKHSGAARITISIRAAPGGWQLVVADNGRGFRETAGRKPGLGLRAMRHRAGLMGMKLEIESGPESGTRVICSTQREP